MFLWSVALAGTVPLLVAPTGHLLVDVEVHGTPRRFLVDSGAGLVVVTPAFAEAGSLPLGRRMEAQAVDGAVSVVLTELTGLVAAEVTFPALRAAVLDLSAPMAEIGPFDGVLGRGFFEAADVVLDLERNTLEVLAPGSLRTVLREAPSVRFRLRRGNPLLTTTIAGTRRRTVLDTGANGSILPLAWAEEAGLAVASSRRGVSGAAGRFVPIGLAVVEDVVVAGVSLGGLDFGTREDEVTATLGIDALGTRRVGLSYRDRRLFLPVDPPR